jgi:hypothetical protein
MEEGSIFPSLYSLPTFKSYTELATPSCAAQQNKMGQFLQIEIKKKIQDLNQKNTRFTVILLALQEVPG